MWLHNNQTFKCTSALFVLQELQHWNYFSRWLRGICSKPGSQLWCRIKMEKERATGAVMKGCAGNLSWRERKRERERERVLPVWCGRADLAGCQPGHSAHEEAVCGRRRYPKEPEKLWPWRELRLSGETSRFTEWSGSDTVGGGGVTGPRAGPAVSPAWSLITCVKETWRETSPSVTLI